MLLSRLDASVLGDMLADIIFNGAGDRTVKVGQMV